MGAPQIVSYYESQYGVNYALPKMDLISEGHLGFAMENYGLIVFDKRALLLSPDNTNPDTEFLVLSVVAHEIGHMWLGNWVTMDWWDQTWLNEGLTEYMTHEAVQAVKPSLQPFDRLYVDETQYVMYYDQDPNYHWALSDAVTTRADIERKFGVFTYDKGASFIRMVKMILGGEAMFQAFTNYLQDYKFDSTVEEDLFEALELAARQSGTWPQYQNGDIINGPQGSLTATLKTWTNQAGLPVVTVGRDCFGECYLSFNQEWFVNTPQSTEQLWDIPLTYDIVPSTKTAEEISPQCWIWTGIQGALLIPLEGLGETTPFLVNLEGFGYYRVNYPEDNWRSLAQVLREDRTQISPISRAMLICDVASLYELGYVTGEIYEDVLSYISEEDEYAPTTAYEMCVNGNRNIKQTKRDFRREKL